MQLEKGTLELLPAALQALRRALPHSRHRTLAPGQERMAEVMQQVAVRLRDNYPYFHPLVCRPDAQATSSDCPRRLRFGHLDQSQ